MRAVVRFAKRELEDFAEATARARLGVAAPLEVAQWSKEYDLELRFGEEAEQLADDFNNPWGEQ